jgi:arylsulfatase A-like enzyme
MRSLLLLSAVLMLAGSRLGAADPPNIVLILADDLGAHDLACEGADLHESPHLDRLATEGVRFTQAYAPSPVCSPTRAAILTGKAPARLHITIWAEGSLKGPTNRKLLQARSLHDLPHGETTLASVLQQAGYLTALVGKWHLGDANHAAETHGFDVNIGGTHWGAPQTFFWPYRGRGRFGNEYRYVPNLEFGQPGEYLTDRLTDEALRVVDHAAQARRPFFLYLAHHAPHTPIEAKPEDVAHFEQKLRPDLRHQNPVYAAMIKSLDDSVGRVLTRLQERGLVENTIVVFTSDNGGFIGNSTYQGKAIPVTNNWPLRSGKGTCYEGGLRVPLVVRWLGVARPGGQCREPVILTDLFHTLLAATGHAAPTGSDGQDLTGLLRTPDATLGRSALHFHYPHYYSAPQSTPVSAVRFGNWKLLELLEDRHVELYDLQNDPGEQRNLADAEPQRVAEFRQRLEEWRHEVSAQMPMANPNFPRQDR